MKKIKQAISGDSNIQIGGDVILTRKVTKVTNIVYDANLHISDAQAKNIRDKIEKIAQSLPNRSYGDAYKMLYNKFHITSYKILPKELYDTAMEWLGKQTAIHRKGLKRNDPEQYRKDMFKALYAKSRQLGVDIHALANTTIPLKEPITSLNELNNTQLQVLYERLHTISRQR